jgi:hypothetical protein
MHSAQVRSTALRRFFKTVPVSAILGRPNYKAGAALSETQIHKVCVERTCLLTLDYHKEQMGKTHRSEQRSNIIDGEIEMHHSVCNGLHL